MKTTREFLTELSDQNIKLWREGDQLRCKAPKGVLTPVLVEQIQTRKADILSFLQQAQPIQPTPTEVARPVLQPGPQDGALPLSFAQQRLWFIHQMQPDSASYHLPGAFRLTGALDTAALARSLSEIVRRHTALRTTFVHCPPLNA